MKLRKLHTSRFSHALLFLLCITTGTTALKAQDITTYQFRQVAPDKAGEFVNRETTYWSKVAQKGIEKGNLTFWGLFEKVGGSDLGNSPNFLFVNTYKDIDNAGNVWNPTGLFPNVAMSKIEDYSFSKTTSNLFALDKGWQQFSKAVPEKDFKYVVIYYHNSSNPDSFVTLENKYWAPFIQSAMDKSQTAQKAWGNAVILAPTGNDMKFNSISIDLFSTLKDALMPNFQAGAVFPNDGLIELGKLRLNPPNREIYRVIKVVNKENMAKK